MPGMANIPQRGFLSKYFVTIIFPVLAGTAIYADWSRTQKFKKGQLEKAPAKKQ